jgi:hypothetical protein
VLSQVRGYLAYNDQACERVLAEMEQIEARLAANQMVMRLRARHAIHSDQEKIEKCLPRRP